MSQQQSCVGFKIPNGSVEMHGTSGMFLFMRCRAAMLVVAASLWLLPGGHARAQDSPLEHKLKTAYLYHFAQFVDWPARTFQSAGSPLFIAVLGQNPFGDELEQTFRGKAINGHPVAVRMLRTAAEASTNCHVLFISSSEKKKLSEIFSALQGLSVLTVGDADSFIESGGMIRFVTVEKKIRFQINDTAAKGAGLSIRAKLLSLALKPGE